ncbi:hypothetical protein DUNSADRAFT_7345 [Dunaliella salina]|uniref:RRM domain-containing protein n=1 Tax=Dunaliella salina TaxID=3046 RepID=A0ABQ7GLI8_DUNSA|nr:hypothetical protein DUNSADRAFT_7345 [Dunaliella salina]|eukprot:KAF5835456.1 hypothetical protein DUNSADRAFT_7345 [Dunaliella salina]
MLNRILRHQGGSWFGQLHLAARFHASNDVSEQPLASASEQQQEQPQNHQQSQAGLSRHPLALPRFPAGSTGARLEAKHMLKISPDLEGALECMTKSDVLNFLEDSSLQPSSIIPAYDGLTLATKAFYVFYDSEERCKAAAGLSGGALGQGGGRLTRVYMGGLPVLLSMPRRKRFFIQLLLNSRRFLLLGTSIGQSGQRLAGAALGGGQLEASPQSTAEGGPKEGSSMLARSVRQQGYSRVVALLAANGPIDRQNLADEFFNGFDLLAPRVFTLNRRQPDGKLSNLVHFANADEAYRALRTKQNSLYNGANVYMKVLE